MDKESKTNLVTTVILTGFVVSVFFHYIKSAYWGLSYPHNTFLFIPSDRFNDFYSLLKWNYDLNPYLRGVATPQYPLLNFISYLFTFFTPIASFALFNFIIIASFIYFNAKSLYTNDRYLYFMRIVVFSFLSYPFLFTIDRGNFEGLLFIFLLCFIYFYQRGQTKVSIVFLACSISMKLFPVVLLILLLSDKKYKESVLAVALTAILTIACLVIFEGGLFNNLIFLIRGSNVQDHQGFSAWLAGNNYVQRGVTLFTFFKIIFNQMNVIDSIDMAAFLKGYFVATTLLFIVLAGYVVLVEKEFWKKTALLVFAMLLFPHISADYKLLHVFIPLLLFIQSEKKSRGDFFYALMFALLLIPKDYYLLPHILSDSGTSDISIAVLLNPLIMLAMMGAIIVSGLKNVDRDEIKNNLSSHVDEIKGLIGFKPITRIR